MKKAVFEDPMFKLITFSGADVVAANSDSDGFGEIPDGGDDD